MERAYKMHLVDNPDQVLPDEFSLHLLDKIFVKAFVIGAGPRKMKIGGVMFTKEVTGPYFSKSKKDHDFETTISGGGYFFKRPSKYKKE